jgi:PAT family beta-lactamase induction signal transducer AmpG
LYLSESKALRIFTLCGLYVAQGIPWGFVTVTLASWLAKPEQGLSTEQLGPILAVATLPWSFKFLWGPLMDRFTIRSLGRRRPWILFAQSMAILVLGSMLLVDDLAGMVWTSEPEGSGFLKHLFRMVPGPLAALILLANVFVSLQDVAVDALAVDLLEEKERGFANGLMYGSSYLGTAIGGAGLGYVVANHGIQAGLFGQAVLLFLIMLLPTFLRERPNVPDQSERKSLEDKPQETATTGSVPIGEASLVPPQSLKAANRSFPDTDQLQERGKQAEDSLIKDIFRAFSLRATLLGLLVAIGVKIGLHMITVVLMDYLLKNGGWTQQQYTDVTGGWAVVLGLLGCLVGGVISDAMGPKRLIAIMSLLLSLLWVGMGSVPGALNSHAAMTGLLVGQELLFAVLSVSLFSLFMSISWPKVAATQFTTYMALMNLSATIGSYLAGYLSPHLSVAHILCLAGVLQALVAVPVLFIDPRQTRRVLGDAT